MGKAMGPPKDPSLDLGGTVTMRLTATKLMMVRPPQVAIMDADCQLLDALVPQEAIAGLKETTYGEDRSCSCGSPP